MPCGGEAVASICFAFSVIEAHCLSNARSTALRAIFFSASDQVVSMRTAIGDFMPAPPSELHGNITPEAGWWTSGVLPYNCLTHATIYIYNLFVWPLPPPKCRSNNGGTNLN